ncbi:MAG: serine--tRNA ligase, partial [Gemmatimonadetes bacterium]
MIDLKLLRASPGQVRAALARRGDPSLTRLLDEIEALDMKRRTLTAQLDTLKAERNDAAKADALVAKSQGGLPEATTAARRKLGERITALESELRQIETTLEAKALFVPNPPLPDVPEEQTILRSWGTPAPKGGKPHWEIAEKLGILDLPRGAKLAGSGFPVLMGAGARLARGLINFMLDLHTREHGYVEVEPPFLVRREVMAGTG